MKTITKLKEQFQTGDKPTQTDFYDWMESYWHKDESPQIKLTTVSEITNQTLATNGYSQNGKNVLIDNGAAAINYKINLNSSVEENFLITGVKLGTGSITFAAGTGSPVLSQIDYTLVMNGTKGSRFMISRVGNTNEFLIFINNL